MRFLPKLEQIPPRPPVHDNTWEKIEALEDLRYALQYKLDLGELTDEEEDEVLSQLYSVEEEIRWLEMR